uniref:Anoct_dimer domain-containing protein n=1 Tax=Ascaris lumbricoides TaxID=6252 RepID=A0A0M3ICE6_ASCLU
MKKRTCLIDRAFLDRNHLAYSVHHQGKILDLIAYYRQPKDSFDRILRSSDFLAPVENDE